MASFAALSPTCLPDRGDVAARVPPPAAPPPTELDARGAKPPNHVRAIVAALAAIPPGAPQYVRTAEAPTELLRELGPHGVEGYPRQLADGTWRTLVMSGDNGGFITSRSEMSCGR
ncbi:MAG TPA: DUF2249 domain-containing protein [Lacunisphaera sp.]|nr:DUF2249 domain-containing protein [Lacunisphaera sp.]